MLKYAREWKIEPEPVDLNDLIQQVVAGTSQTASEHSVLVRTDIDSKTPVVHCDPRLIHMCLMDMTCNAVDACDVKDYNEGNRPEIVIRGYSSADGTTAVIEVEDNGIGMTSDVMDNVFTPFFSTKKHWGTGLGLALTARIVEQHNGEIAVESEPNVGSVFRITLPFENRTASLGGDR
jgi:signal transduction histidine kinase